LRGSGAVLSRRAPGTRRQNMITRDRLTQYLARQYSIEQYVDYCQNGLQVEGKDQINTIVFGVTFHMPFLIQAIATGADALIVHHGIFQKGVFKVTGALRKKIKLLMDHDISLYGIHLPMDAHPEIGHSALLFSAIGVQKLEPFDVGYIGNNTHKYSLEKMLEIYHKMLHPEMEEFGREGVRNDIFSLWQKQGFTVLRNGPEIPGKIAIMTGESAGYYEKSIEMGVDTFFGGNIKEHIPAVSLESGTNYVNLGHYYSEKPGVLALKERISKDLEVETKYVEVVNPV